MKKLFTLFFAFVATTSLFAKGTLIGTLRYELWDDLTATVCYETTTTANYENLSAVEIPATVKYNGKTYTVTAIGENAFKNAAKLTLATTGDSVRSVATGAFENCAKLTTIVFGQNVKTIRTRALKGCTSLQSVGWYAKDCSDFEITNTPFFCSKGGDDNFSLLSQITSFTFGPKVAHVPAYLCDRMSNLPAITITDNIQSIGQYAFRNCSTATVTLGDGLQEIGAHAFDGCIKITDLKLPDAITKLDAYAFTNCSALKSVHVGKNLTSMETSVFANCNALKTVYWDAVSCQDFADQNTPFWRSGTFDIRANITSLTFGPSVQRIPAFLCDGLTHLASIEIVDGIQQIGESAFRNCILLSSIDVPSSIKFFGPNVFSGCSTLKKVHWNAGYFNEDYFLKPEDNPLYPIRTQIEELTFGDALYQLPSYMCYEMSKLKDISVNVYFISSKAFYGCTSLDTLRLGSKLEDCEKDAFEGLPNLKAFTTETDEGSYRLFAIDGVLYWREYEDYPYWAYMCPQGKTGNCTMPERTYAFIKNAFANCTKLTSITCPATTPPRFDDDVTEPFKNMDLTQVILYVPAESVNSYKNFRYWEDFANILPIGTGIEEVLANPASNGRKVMVDGQVLIVNDNKAFTLQGTQVK